MINILDLVQELHSLTQPHMRRLGEAMGDIQGELDRLQKKLTGLETQISKAAQDQWVELSLDNGWANYGGGFQPLAVRMIGRGLAAIVGTIKDGTFAYATRLATLPLGYRPQKAVHMTVTAHTTVPVESEFYTPHVILHQNGDVTLGGAVGGNVWLAISGIYRVS